MPAPAHWPRAAAVGKAVVPPVAKFWSQAKVEMRPPSVRMGPSLAAAAGPGRALTVSFPRLQFSELGAVQQSFNSIVKSTQKLSFLNLTVKEAAINAAVTAEVLCWFFVGEMVGRGSLIGYDA